MELHIVHFIKKINKTSAELLRKMMMMKTGRWSSRRARQRHGRQTPTTYLPSAGSDLFEKAFTFTGNKRINRLSALIWYDQFSLAKAAINYTIYILGGFDLRPSKMWKKTQTPFKIFDLRASNLQPPQPPNEPRTTNPTFFGTPYKYKKNIWLSGVIKS